MKRRLNPAEARAFVARWQKVNAAEARLLQVVHAGALQEVDQRGIHDSFVSGGWALYAGSTMITGHPGDGPQGGGRPPCPS